ncbi:E3 ubiquitin-protein ligase SPL2-like [Silene latifolia]|uniref:E3 ubiquitin-protein ligase SPL2-like n=1 Tax=Silene latifolia TaxID=37657 RepID=UPI003D76FE0C
MSAGDQAAAAIVTHLALAADGAVIGATLAYIAIRSIVKYVAASSALHRIRDAPSVHVSDLRSILAESDAGDDANADGGGDDVIAGGGGGERLVVVRGTVESKSAVNGSWKSLWTDVLVSHDSGDRAVVIQRSQKYVYNEWRGLFGWYPDLRAVLGRIWREQGSTTTRTVPFVLVDSRQQALSDYVVVDLDGSTHPLPLTTVYREMKPIQASPYTFLQALFGHDYPVGLVDEEKVLPLGKDVTVVGVCSSKDGAPSIKSCKDLPYFLCDLTKEQMLIELSVRSKVLLWSGIVVGTVSIGVLGYSIVRNWNKWKQWREQRRAQQERHDMANNNEEPELDEIEDDEMGDIPDGQLCVICLMRRRRAAFVPCGHLVCCPRCAYSVERDLVPKCPVCRQEISNSVRIYDS